MEKQSGLAESYIGTPAEGRHEGLLRVAELFSVLTVAALT